ncbi:AI-2E family transporter [Kozakia baliensis]|uniref:AI-2E family transporter n=1 Tax=Kozakia baliensis TaxID=153496 RepID=UPI000A8F80B8|nr:AI-2E family transporter [Kozakia baliensis]
MTDDHRLPISVPAKVKPDPYPDDDDEAVMPDPMPITPLGRTQRRARSLLATGFLLLALYTLKNFLPALLWGSVFAIATWPLYRRAELRFGKSDWLPMLFTAAIALIFLVPLSIVGVKAAEEAQSVLRWLDDVRHNGIPMPSWINKLPFERAAAARWWQNNLVNPEHLAKLLHSFDATHSMAVTRQVTSQVTRRATLFLFSIVTLFFLLRDGADIIHRSLIASNRTFGQRGESLARQIISSVHGTVAGLVLVGLGEGMLMGVAYILAGAPQPLLFAMLTAVAAMVPFLALPTVMLAGALILMQGKMIAAIIVVAIGAIIIFVADHFVRPVLIGGSTQMPFLWVLLGILGGVETWGLLGLFLGPAIMAAVHLLWRIWSSDTPQDHFT